MKPLSPLVLVVAACALLAGCSDSQRSATGQVNVDGQVSATSASAVSYYQAARLLDQASWGPSPDSIAEVQQLGVAGWIDRQLSMPATTLNAPRYVIEFDTNNRAQQDLAEGWFESRFIDAALSGQDQLRQRAAWAFYNFIPTNAGNAYGRTEYYNTLQRAALGNFKDLLREVSLSPVMGVFLNNDQNEANRPNENYARELMQLFSVGLVLLNPDGSTQRDARGAPLETYTQQDVKEATRALSGWTPAYEANLPNSNYGNFGKKMIPKARTETHDSGAKRVLGRDIRAGQSAAADLESLLDILVNHPNTAPFVSRRLIQHLVSSDPSPAYMTRIANVFTQTQGDIKAVVRAILLDPEARAGDNPSRIDPRIGKIREPLLSHTNALRGMGCRAAMAQSYNPSFPFWTGQNPYRAPSVFGYFPPNHKTPESLNSAPEEKLLDAGEFSRRASNVSGELDQQPNAFRAAGCQIDLIEATAKQSDEALIALVAERYLRGNMPPPLRLTMQTILRDSLANQLALRKFGDLMGLAQVSPAGSVVR